jgi:hypothetical protein
MDASARLIGAPFEVSDDNAVLNRPALVWSGTQWGVVWMNIDAEVRLARRGRFGHAVGEDIIAVTGGGLQEVMSLAWNGQSFGAVWDDGAGSTEIYFADALCSCDTTDADGDGFSQCEGECDDEDDSVYPDAPEVCDGNDNNCDESVPADERDNDGDRYVECTGWNDTQGDQPLIIGGGDCNDGDSQTFPGAPEVCDRVDTDCDGIEDLGDADLDFGFDTDGDGLLDCWEVYGLDVNDGDLTCKPDAATGCDLPLQLPPYAADRTRPDLYVEIDYMDCEAGGCAEDHGFPTTHRPLSEALGRVRSAFARRGIALHLVGAQGAVDEAIPEIESVVFGPASAPGPADDFWDLKWGSALQQDPCTTGSAGAHFGTLADRTAPDCLDRIDARRRVFRYVIFGHSGPTGWGTAELHGNDLLVSTGGQDETRATRDVAVRWETTLDAERADMEAGILIHVLGHGLGLGHGGVDSVGQPVESPGCKPNHLGVTSFTRVWNLAGAARDVPGEVDGTPVRTNRELDFSGQILPGAGELDELALQEFIGVQGPSGERIMFGGVAGTPIVSPASGPVDWNGNGMIDGGAIVGDVNFVSFGAGSTGCPASLGEILPGTDEWIAVRLEVPLSATIVDTPPLPPLATDEVFPPIEPGFPEYLNGGLGDEDADGDGTANLVDICPLIQDLGALDADGDGWGDPCDCLPGDAAYQATPSESRDLRWESKTELSWIEPFFSGTTALVYDVLRSGDPDDFGTGIVCVEPNDADRMAIDTDIPPWWGLYYYLIRAENACPEGQGPLGESSGGVPRVGAACP